MSNELTPVLWYDHDCEWTSKYCDDHHTRTARIPMDVLLKYSDADAVLVPAQEDNK